MANDEFKNFSALLAELQAAKERYEETQREEGAARSRSTAALNHLNGLQKKFDAVVVGMQNEAPRDTDWGQKRISPLRVAQNH